MQATHSNHHQQRRHQHYRNIITYASTTIISIYGTYKLASWAWDTWNKKKQLFLEGDDHHSAANPSILSSSSDNNTLYNAFPMVSSSIHNFSITSSFSSNNEIKMNKSRMKYHYQKHINFALADFLPTLIKSINEYTDTTKETKQLKLIRLHQFQKQKQKDSYNENDDEREDEEKNCNMKQKQELWDIIKRRLLTRMMVTSYGHTLLYLILVVQLSLLRRQTLRVNDDDKNIQCHDTTTTPNNNNDVTSQKELLSQTLQYFFTTGLSSMCKTIDSIICDSLQDWNVSDASMMQLSFQEFTSGIQHIRQVLEKDTSFSLNAILLPEEQNHHLESVATTKLLDESFDLFESPMFHYAFQDSIECTFHTLENKYWKGIFQVNGIATTTPLVKVITQLKQFCSSFYRRKGAVDEFPSYSNEYLPMIEKIPTVLELGDICSS